MKHFNQKTRSEETISDT